MLTETAPPFAFAHLLAPMLEEGRPAPPLWRVVSDPCGVALLYGHLGEFCHEFRNRLNSVQLCLYLADPEADCHRGAWGEAEAAYRDVLGRIDCLQEICRPMKLHAMRFSLGLMMADFVEAWARRFSSRGIRLQTRSQGRDDEGDFDPMRLAQGLEAIGAWRLGSAPAGTDLEVAWGTDGDEMWVAWDESRPRGVADGSDPGSSGFLALALAARIVAEHGGRMDVSDGPGMSISLRWPRRAAPADFGAGLGREIDGAGAIPDEATLPAGRT